MAGRDLLALAIALAFCGVFVVYAGDDDGLRGLTVKEQMRDANFWQNWYDPKPVLDKKERDKMREPIEDRVMSDDEIDRMDVARHLLPPPGDAVAGQLIAEVRRLRLTDAEITEIELLARLAEQDADAASFVLDIDRARACERRSAILRGLLERLK